ncbi:MAG: hypothetical protein ACM31C_01450 [Acidobacteriota bacterium]
MWKGLTMFSLAGAAIAVVPTSPRETVLPLTRHSLGGTIDVVSFGVAELVVDDRPISALQVRATFANRTDTMPWTVELASSQLELRGSSDAHPILINSDLRNLPIGIIGRGERRVADLYFALPAGSVPDTFAVMYRVNTADHRFLGKAELARATRTAEPAERLPAPGWGSTWWANPEHAWPTYEHRNGKLTPRAPKQIAVLRAPHGFYEEQPATDEEWPRTDECNDW